MIVAAGGGGVCVFRGEDVLLLYFEEISRRELSRFTSGKINPRE